MKSFRFVKSRFTPIRFRFFDDGGEGGAGEGGAGEGGEGGAGGEIKFTPEQQKHIDNIINKRFKKERQEKETLTAKLKQLESTANLTKEERDELTKQISDLESSMLTKEEQAAKAQKDLTDRHSKELKKAQETSDLWQNRFTVSTVERALTDAAVAAEAVSPMQIRMMLQSNTVLVEDIDDNGKKKGTFTPHTTFIGKNEEGEQVEITLPTSKALSKMKDDGLNPNLFGHKAQGGTGTPPAGQGGGSSNKMPDRKSYPTDEAWRAAYIAWRAKHDLDGTPLQTK